MVKLPYIRFFNLNCIQKQLYSVQKTFKLCLNNPVVQLFLDKLTNQQFQDDYFIKESSQNKTRMLSDIRSLTLSKKLILESIESLEELKRGKSEDKDLQKLVEEEKETYVEQLKELDNKLLHSLIPEPVPNFSDIEISVTAGVGGQEAMLFAKDIFSMYRSYVLYKGWTSAISEFDTSDIGGLRHASLLVTGKGSYHEMRHEAGVHRVQRVPSTEKSGRVHTSTVAVAVLPQPDEVDVALNEKDLKIETKRASGPGGQSVNKSESAIRIVHIPTGIAVDCQSERTQTANRKLAMNRLRARIYQQQIDQQTVHTRTARKLQVGSSGRSEKIRTYNFNQDRITDHRLCINAHNIPVFLQGQGHLDSLINQLEEQYEIERLEEFITSLVTQ